MAQNIYKRDYLILTTLYLMSNFLLSLVYGVFWDDWSIFRNPIGIEQEFFNGNGGVVVGYIHLFLQQTFDNPVLVYRSLILLMGWGDVLLLYFLLQLMGLSYTEARWISLLYAAFPLGYAHMTMICLPYQIGLFCFLLAAVLFMKASNNKSIALYFISMVFVFLSSMFLPSTIVLWFGFLCFMSAKSSWSQASFSKTYFLVWSKNMIRNCLFFIPCIIFWIIRNAMWMPQGVYANTEYNSFSGSSMIMAPFNLLASLLRTIAFPASQIATIFPSKFFVLLFVLIFIICFLLLKNKSKDLYPSNAFLKLIVCLFFYVCSVAAYLLVGKVPEYDSVADRFCILCNIAFVGIIFYMFSMAKISCKLRKHFFVLTIALFCTYSNFQYIESIRLSQRNDAIIQFFKSNPLPIGNVFVVENGTEIGSRFYTWSGLYHEATGKQDRCFLCNGDKTMYDDEIYLLEMYCQRDVTPGNPQLALISVGNPLQRSNINTIKQMYFRFFNRTQYLNNVTECYHFVYTEL